MAVITAVRVRLWPLFTQRSVALLGLESTGAALLRARRAQGPADHARGGRAVPGRRAGAGARAHRARQRRWPGDHPAYLLVECAGPDRSRATSCSPPWRRSVSSPTGVADIVLGEDGPTRERLWRYREAHTESINAAGVPVKLDVAVPHASARGRAGRAARRRPPGGAGRASDRLRPPERGQPARECPWGGRVRGGRGGDRRRADAMSRRSVAASAPSTASAGPRRHGCTCRARPPSWPPCGRSRPRWTPTAS